MNMKRVLHVMNWHRGGGGSDNAARDTIQLTAGLGYEVDLFERDSVTLGAGLKGKFNAFVSGIHAREGVNAFKRRLEGNPPDLVHVHELYPFISPWILPECRRRGIPVVMTVYDFRLTCPVATHHNGREICHRCLDEGSHCAILENCRQSIPESVAFAARHAVAKHWNLYGKYVDHYVVLTQFCANWLVEKQGILPERISVIPCVVDCPDRFSEDPSKGKYVFFAGRFVREKGVEELIEACRRLRLPLKLAGKQSSHPAIQDSDDIECLQNQNREQLLDYYLGAKLVVIPSLWYETFGLVAAEAAALGLPCVASRIGALQETVVDGETGILVNPGDIDALASAIETIWNDPALARQYGANARRNVLNFFSKSRVSDLLGALYSQVLKSCK